jgi:hypothetical protein
MDSLSKGKPRMSVLTQIISAFAIAAFSAWITVQLSLRRFRTEKWWERKVEAYAHIVEALHHAKTTLEINYDAEIEGRRIPEKRDEQLNERNSKANDDIRKNIDTSAFLLCDEAHQRLVQFQKEAYDAESPNSYFEYLDGMIPVYRKCIEDIIVIARKDLGVRYR